MRTCSHTRIVRGVWTQTPVVLSETNIVCVDLPFSLWNAGWRTVRSWRSRGTTYRSKGSLATGFELRIILARKQISEAEHEKGVIIHVEECVR